MQREANTGRSSRKRATLRFTKAAARVARIGNAALAIADAKPNTRRSSNARSILIGIGCLPIAIVKTPLEGPALILVKP
jgi:hypothetical protein